MGLDDKSVTNKPLPTARFKRSCFKDPTFKCSMNMFAMTVERGDPMVVPSVSKKFLALVVLHILDKLVDPLKQE